MTVATFDSDLIDRRYLSQYASEQVGLIVTTAAGPTDADGNMVTVSLVNDVDGTVLFSRPADHDATGTYSTTLSSTDTAAPGLYSVLFAYRINGVDDSYALPVRVGTSSPAYDALPVGMKMIVENTWIRFADLYDSAVGGPHLQTYVQTHFGRNRLAQLLRQAIGRLNTVSQPTQTYSVDLPFPFQQWGPLLEQALYVEVLKHLRRSYVEMPEVVLSTSVSRTDRRDYMARWGDILADEKEDLDDMMGTFKMAAMNLGGVSVLISGGAYGRLGPTVMAGGLGAAAARGYFYGQRVY